MNPDDAAAYKGRISELGSRLDKAKADRQAEVDANLDAEMRGRGMAYGMRMAAELVAAVIVGGLIGYGLDSWLGSKPWLFLLFFVLGFAAGAAVSQRDVQDHGDDDYRRQERGDRQQDPVVGQVFDVRMSLRMSHCADIPRRSPSSAAVTLL